MKALNLFFLIFLLLGPLSLAQSQIFNDTLIYVTSGLQPDRSSPQINSLIGLEQEGIRLNATQGYKFVSMRPGSGSMIRDSLLYLVPDGYRSRSFSGRAVTTRNQKAAIFVLSCPDQRIQLANNGRSIVPGRGCRFSPYRNGMGLKGKYILVVPEY